LQKRLVIFKTINLIEDPAMKKTTVLFGGALLAGTMALTATTANAWWGSGWGNDYGPWGGGPWYGGYPYGGYGYPYGGWGYPYGGWGGYPYGGYGYPYGGWGGYPYGGWGGYPYGGYPWGAAPVVVQPQAPATSSSK
jgi:hypothetical protein